jgi:hypothetical protein
MWEHIDVGSVKTIITFTKEGELKFKESWPQRPYRPMIVVGFTSGVRDGCR